MHARLVAFGGSGLRVRRLGGDRAGEIRLTRFLRNKAVTPEAMVAEAAVRTGERCAGRHVLAIQDTTVVRSAGGGGLYLHPVLAVDAQDGAILGLTHATFLQRDAGKAGRRRQTPVKDKESQRWIDGAERSAQVCRTAAKVTHIADREADIFALFARCPQGTALLVRAAHDRALDDGGRLFAQLDAVPVAGRAEIDLPAGPGRKARTAKVAARFMSAAIARPRNGLVEDLPKSVTVTLVDIREEAPPNGEAPVHWRLITTEVVSDAAGAFAVADLYRRRWCIEQLFRTLKTKGFDIEGVLIEEEAPLRRLVMAALLAAVTIQQLVHARDGNQGPSPLRPLTDAFEPEDKPLLQAFCAKLEGKTLRQKNPHPKGTLAYAAWVCARLGGWTGYYGKPGPIVMLQGWLYFQAAKYGASLSKGESDA
ncbi:MAG TPA: IS4 family transposase [Verrucomicrobiae bacterium]|nr:IS4 family transposase [Verrucomicrobiae bacterium]